MQTSHEVHKQKEAWALKTKQKNTPWGINKATPNLSSLLAFLSCLFNRSRQTSLLSQCRLLLGLQVFSTFKTQTDTDVSKIPACPRIEAWINPSTVRALLLLLLGYSHLLSIADIIYCKSQLGATSSWRPPGCFYSSWERKESFYSGQWSCQFGTKKKTRCDWTSSLKFSWNRHERVVFHHFPSFACMLTETVTPEQTAHFAWHVDISSRGMLMHPRPRLSSAAAHPNWAKSNSFTLSETSCV